MDRVVRARILLAEATALGVSIEDLVCRCVGLSMRWVRCADGRRLCRCRRAAVLQGDSDRVQVLLEAGGRAVR